MISKKIILPELRFQQASPEDMSLFVNLNNNEKIINENERNIVLNLADQFNKERTESNKYKIFGKVNMVFKNLYSGSTSYSKLKENLVLINDGTNGNYDGFLPYNEFAFIRNDVYNETYSIPKISGSTYGTYNPTINTSTNPNNKHQNISLIASPYHNWNFYITYVYSSDYHYSMTYTLSGTTKVEGINILNFLSGDGIPCRVEDFDTYYKITTPVEHGINENEFVIFPRIQSLNGKAFSIYRLGDSKYKSENFVININKTQLNGVTIPQLTTIKRCVDKLNIDTTTSKYYVNKHKTLTTINDYTLDTLSFETPIFRDEKKRILSNIANRKNFILDRNRPETLLYDFKNPIDVSDLSNNFNHEVTDIYLTTIFRNGSGYFDYPLRNGYKFNFHNNWIDNHFSKESSLETTIPFTFDMVSEFTFKYGLPLTKGTILNGDFIEFNPYTLKERTISSSFHKLTNPTNIFDYKQYKDVPNFSGSTIQNKSGLFYQPHYKIKLKDLSDYVEVVNTNTTADLPKNSYYDGTNWRWRDIYEHGFIDSDGRGTNYPFFNGVHYIKNDVNFYLRNERLYINKNDGIKNFASVNLKC